MYLIACIKRTFKVSRVRKVRVIVKVSRISGIRNMVVFRVKIVLKYYIIAVYEKTETALSTDIKVVNFVFVFDKINQSQSIFVY